MDKGRKKELKEQYKLMKPKMGVFIIRSNMSNKCYIQAAKDLRAIMNGALARLGGGFHPYRELQKEWNHFGSDGFAIEILENLEYDKDESKTDYSEDLTLLQMIWETRMKKRGFELYLK